MEKFEAMEVAMQMIRAVKPLIDAIAKQDPDLADELRRASKSSVLKLGEGNRRIGRDRIRFFSYSAGSVDESRRVLAVAQVWDYVTEVTEADGFLDRMGAMLYRLMHPRA
jgi:four helix bundle protein